MTRALNSGLIPMPVSSLSKALQLYQLRPSAGAFSFSALPHVEAPGGAAHPAEAGGGYGYVSDFPVERIWRDVRVCQIYEGTSDIQKILIGRALANEG